jgi:squalene-hopene/tetraprenyl-beta-curcumene cyclase
MTIEAPSARQAFESTAAALLGSRNSNGHWEGQLSSSALSTATAIFTIHLYAQTPASAISDDERRSLDQMVRRGAEWLISTQNPDGGWGDTIRSISNISTTALCWDALSACINPANPAVRSAEAWLVREAGSIEPCALAATIKARYGKDKTFSVPILTMCALAGRLGKGRGAWRLIPQLPFELAVLPHWFFQWVKLPVVSYALPALIAIGQVRHFNRPSHNPLFRLLRAAMRRRTLRLLKTIQPPGGGFLEATPLTSFVAMSLIACGQANGPVVRDGIDFLLRSVLPDGSWPIDTNLATWVTTLSVNALSRSAEFDWLLPEPQRKAIRDWLLAQQYRVEHPYTHAAPGAWAWTDLPGGVPDADDTAGALLALWNLGFRDAQVLAAVEAGVNWLLDLQNRDGGIPTFCRGWGSLPFDRSGADLTAHALHAWSVWKESLPDASRQRIDRAITGGLKYLALQQTREGAWPPLWFGNQHAPESENLTYGTSRVLVALHSLDESKFPQTADLKSRAADWLISAQNENGSWGGAPGLEGTIEETAIAIVGLKKQKGSAAHESIRKALAWLAANTVGGSQFKPSPIGLYFAKLWYFERLYPIIFSAAAFASLRAITADGRDRSAD